MPPVCAGPPALLKMQSSRPNLSVAVPDQRPHLVLLGHVGLAKDTGGAEFLRQGLAFACAAARDHHLRAFVDEDFRRPQTDAAGCTGDHCYLAVEPSHAVSPLCVCLSGAHYRRAAHMVQARRTKSEAHRSLQKATQWFLHLSAGERSTGEA